jgi:hypothetical protein
MRGTTLRKLPYCGPMNLVEGMNEQKAFDWVVRSLRVYDWSADAPDPPRFQVNDDSLTIRELCERVKKVDEPLSETIKYDLYPILAGHRTCRVWTPAC